MQIVLHVYTLGQCPMQTLDGRTELVVDEGDGELLVELLRPADAAYRSRLAYILLYPVTVSSAYRDLTSSIRTDSTSECNSE